MKNPDQPVPQHWSVRFFTIWTGQAFSLFGSALVQFALIWWLTQKTHSAVTLTMATLVGMLPQVFLGPFAGALVDRWNRRIIMIVADGSIALATLALAGLFATGQIQVWHVYLALAVRSLGGAFHFPAMSASTPLMVPEKHLTRISGMNQTLQGVIGMIAPPAGALLLEVLSTQGVLMIDVVTAAIAIAPLFFFSIPQPVRQVSEEHAEKSNLFTEVREGFQYIRGWTGLMAVLGMAFFLNFLLTPTGSLMPLLITNHFGKGALEFGLMDSASGLGMVLGGLLLSVWGGFKRKIATSMTGIVGIGFGVMLTGFAPAGLFWLAVAGTALSTFMLPIANGPLGAILQGNVRPDMQGRVMSLVGSVATAMTPLGLLIAGPFSDAFGIRTWYWVAGLLTILMGVGGFLTPVVMNVENNRNGISAPQADSTLAA
jgi:DHA3 family macrolide efflux protein-like MFS transporter